MPNYKSQEANLQIYLYNMEELEVYRWLGPSDNFTTTISPIQDSLNNACTTPMGISKSIVDAHYPANYDIPLLPLTFDLPANFEIISSDAPTTLMNVSQTAPGLDNFPYKLLYFFTLIILLFFPIFIHSHLVLHLSPPPPKKKVKVPVKYF
jgi:hypothetical protein